MSGGNAVQVENRRVGAGRNYTARRFSALTAGNRQVPGQKSAANEAAPGWGRERCEGYLPRLKGVRPGSVCWSSDQGEGVPPNKPTPEDLVSSKKDG
jgi:hypothetical protein